MYYARFTFLTMSCFFFQAKANCPGDIPLQNGECPDFECLGRTSCSNHGDCNSEGTGCDCDPGFSGSDCSYDLQGDNFSLIYICYFIW